MSDGTESAASGALRRALELVSGRPSGDRFPPRHRAHAEFPHRAHPELQLQERVDASPQIVFSPDPGRFPRGPLPSPTPFGFRSTQDVVSEMSPVIYRPGGGKPERPSRRSTDDTPRPPIAPSTVPTAGSYAPPPPAPVPPPTVPRPDISGFDEDPDIADDELDAAADDALLDSLDAVEPRRSEQGGPDAREPRRLDAAGLDEPTIAPPAREPRTKASARSTEPEPWVDPVAPPAPTQPPRYAVPKPRYAARPAQPPTDPAPAPIETGTVPDWIDEHPVDLPPYEEPTPDPPAPEPVAEELLAPEPAVEPPAATPLDPAPAPRRPRVRTLHISAPPVGPGDEPTPEPEAFEPPMPPADEPEEPVDLRVDDLDDEDDFEESDDEITVPVDDMSEGPRTGPAITGKVTSTRGRGLSGITVSLVDRDDEVVASVGTGRGGEYVFDDVAPGVYRIAVTDDIDGDFASAWFGADEVDDAEPIELIDADTALRGVDLAMRSAVSLDAEVEVKRRKTEVEVVVTDNATGLPATGSVQVTTDLFSAVLPLVKGRASVTLIGSATEWGAGVPRLPKRARLEFRGGKHSAAVTRTVKLR